MALYRVLKNLSTGHKKGDIVDGDQFKSLDILVARGAMAPASTPPLTELPGWSKRIDKLAALDIITVQDFIDADPEVVAKKFGYKSTVGVEKWKKDAVAWLQPPKVAIRSG